MVDVFSFNISHLLSLLLGQQPVVITTKFLMDVVIFMIQGVDHSFYDPIVFISELDMIGFCVLGYALVSLSRNERTNLSILWSDRYMRSR